MNPVQYHIGKRALCRGFFVITGKEPFEIIPGSYDEIGLVYHERALLLFHDESLTGELNALVFHGICADDTEHCPLILEMSLAVIVAFPDLYAKLRAVALRLCLVKLAPLYALLIAEYLPFLEGLVGLA